MTDVALRAGVSQATVSLVLSGTTKARVSTATRERVREAAEALGYPLRGAPRAAGHRLVLMLLDEVVATPFAPPLIDGARDEAAQRGALVAVLVTGRDGAQDEAALDAMAGPGLAGVLRTTLVTRAVELPGRLLGRPTVLLNCHEAGAPRLPSVVPADLTAAFEATGHLIRLGHRRIAHLHGEAWGEAARERAKGFRQALASADIPLDPDLLAGPAFTMDSGRTATLRLLDLPQPPTAILCFNDRVAVGAYEAAALRNVDVPGDLSIMGFDDEDFSGRVLPPLTTMRLPHDEMARRAVALLLDGASPPGRIKIDFPLVSRASVAPPPSPRS